VVKSIFELPNVEPASHSFSHPFIWQFNLPVQFQPTELYYGHNLSIKGYQLNIEREIAGSINYINSLLKDSKKELTCFSGQEIATLMRNKYVLLTNLESLM